MLTPILGKVMPSVKLSILTAKPKRKNSLNFKGFSSSSFLKEETIICTPINESITATKISGLNLNKESINSPANIPNNGITK